MGTLDWMNAPITQGFGPTDEPLDGPYAGYAHFNKGFDFGVPPGTPIGSNVTGVVIAAGDQGDGWGYSVKIRDADGYTHNFGHLGAWYAKVGMTVNVGDEIGVSGGEAGSPGAGSSTGAHLSYDVWAPDGSFVAGTPFLSAAAQNAMDYQNGAGEMANGMTPEQYWASKKRLQELYPTVYPWLSFTPQQLANLGYDTPPSQQDIAEFLSLDNQIAAYEAAGGGNPTDPDQVMRAYDFYNKNSAGAIDAENAAARYAQEAATRQQAASEAGQGLTDQYNRVSAAQQGGNTTGGQTARGYAVAMPDKLKTGQEMFDEALTRIKSSLPAFVPKPYSALPQGSIQDWIKTNPTNVPYTAQGAAAPINLANIGNKGYPAYGTGSFPAGVNGSNADPFGSTFTPETPPGTVTFDQRVPTDRYISDGSATTRRAGVSTPSPISSYEDPKKKMFAGKGLTGSIMGIYGEPVGY